MAVKLTTQLNFNSYKYFLLIRLAYFLLYNNSTDFVKRIIIIFHQPPTDYLPKIALFMQYE